MNIIEFAGDVCGRFDENEPVRERGRKPTASSRDFHAERPHEFQTTQNPPHEEHKIRWENYNIMSRS